jgi:hypothetical protein
VTSTLPVFEQTSRIVPRSDPAQLAVLAPQAREAYLYVRERRAAADPAAREQAERAFKTGMALERRFVERGGLLLAGCDPTGSGGVVPGFSDHRELELLVEAGFTPVEAIRIAHVERREYLGVADSLGSVAPGKLADLSSCAAILRKRSPTSGTSSSSSRAASVTTPPRYSNRSRPFRAILSKKWSG